MSDTVLEVVSYDDKGWVQGFMTLLLPSDEPPPVAFLEFVQQAMLDELVDKMLFEGAPGLVLDPARCVWFCRQYGELAPLPDQPVTLPLRS